jgi:hypothetical protein
MGCATRRRMQDLILDRQKQIAQQLESYPKARYNFTKT